MQKQLKVIQTSHFLLGASSVVFKEFTDLSHQKSFLAGLRCSPHLQSQHVGGGRDRWISEFEAGMVYTVSFKIASTIYRNPVLKITSKMEVGSP